MAAFSVCTLRTNCWLLILNDPFIRIKAANSALHVPDVLLVMSVPFDFCCKGHSVASFLDFGTVDDPQ